MDPPRIKLCTLGMFIIDEIDYTGSQKSQASVIGGAGTYAAIGARLVAGAEHSGSIGWIVDIGSDFPIEFRQVIESWRTTCLFREDKKRLTTRAWNGYGPGDHRAFEYLTPKMRIDHNSLSDELLHAQAFHFVCSAERCMTLIHGILDRLGADRNSEEHSISRPLCVWEPLPELCTPEHVQSFKKAIRHINIVSPNSEELSGFFAGDPRSEAHIAAKVLGWGIGPSDDGVLVVRDGKNGCSAYSSAYRIHVRAYHCPDEDSQSKVVDPTGGGNAFLGALAMALSGDAGPSMRQVNQILAPEKPSFPGLTIPLVYATVAASFIIEQPGVPAFHDYVNGSEAWNGEQFEDRLRRYLSREKAYLTGQMKQ